MLEALVAGERDPKVLADLAKRTLRHKIPDKRRVRVLQTGTPATHAPLHSAEQPSGDVVRSIFDTKEIVGESGQRGSESGLCILGCLLSRDRQGSGCS